MYGLGSFSKSEKVLLNCCGESSWITYSATGNQQSGIECGNWVFNVTFAETDPNNCITGIQGVKWFNPITHHEVKGQNVNFFIAGGHANIELKFWVMGACGNQEFTITCFADNNPDCPSDLCHSTIDYCKTVNGCWNVLGNQYEHDLTWIKMVDGNGDCFYLSATNNPYGIFHFPYNLHHEEACQNHMPNMYDLINDLNTFLSPQYGHIGHAFICTYEGPPAPDCKIKFQIVGSDLSFQKWITYHWHFNVEKCDRYLVCNPGWWTLAEGNNCFVPYYCDLQLPLVNSFGDSNPDNFKLFFEQASVLDFIVEPNLTDDLINVKILSTMEKNIEIQIFDVNGKVLQSKIIEDDEMEINISYLKNGIYFVRLLDKSKGNACTKKFIKI